MPAAVAVTMTRNDDFGFYLYQNVTSIVLTSVLGSARTGVPCSKQLLQVALGLHAQQSQTCRFRAVEENRCQYAF
jgi:hypothetical protein